MPTYDYECKKTGRRFEHFQNMSDRPLRKCPECGGSVRRLIGTGSAVIMKSGGSRGPQCGRTQTCCGRDMPCDSRPCD